MTGSDMLQTPTDHERAQSEGVPLPSQAPEFWWLHEEPWSCVFVHPAPDVRQGSLA